MMKKIMLLLVILLCGCVEQQNVPVATTLPQTTTTTINVFAQATNWEPYFTLIENTDHCLVDCYAIFEIENPTDQDLKLKNNGWKTWHEKAKGAKSLKKDLIIEQIINTSYEEEELIFELVDVEYSCPRNKLEVIYEETLRDLSICRRENGSILWRKKYLRNITGDPLIFYEKELKGTHHANVTRWKDTYIPFDSKRKTLKAGEKICLKVSGKKKAMLGKNSVDWKLKVFGYEPSWAWWNSSWLYRQNVTISRGSAGALEEFQVTLKLDTATLVAASKMRDDNFDIRVVNSSEEEIDFHIQSGSQNTEGTWITVRVPYIPASGTEMLQVYYGSSGASINIGDGDAVYEWFEDFEDLSTGILNGKGGWVSDTGQIGSFDDTVSSQRHFWAHYVEDGNAYHSATLDSQVQDEFVYGLLLRSRGGKSILTSRVQKDTDDRAGVGIAGDNKYIYLWEGGYLDAADAHYNEWIHLSEEYNTTYNNFQIRRVNVNHTSISNPSLLPIAGNAGGDINRVYAAWSLNADYRMLMDEMYIAKFAQRVPTFSWAAEDEIGGHFGDSCTSDSDCTLDHCVEGVCCDTTCTTYCQSCLAEYTASVDGTCADIDDGKDPYDDCTPSLNCNDGLCNGTGGCGFLTSGAGDCIPCQTCDGASSFDCEEIALWENDTQGGVTRCGGCDMCYYGACNVQPRGWDLYDWCDAIDCKTVAPWYWGWYQDECHYQGGVIPKKEVNCDGWSSCQNNFNLCPLQSRGISTAVECDCAAQREGCSELVAGSCSETDCPPVISGIEISQGMTVYGGLEIKEDWD